ncbi:Ig-like domain-containing protein [Pseudomarimonas arenosa]|uniref:Uncharacterized protein n=1 Tax=Pseudomarimonas arenosa TaxID=2774145 RepID=A0AAW3ZM92_9GAMM|nr:Ig-like domain-containing protein [Pseudomarimonas arenosa]MBD8526302.1 hypothetical protein [Pseudomarimonas arenosa]
MGLVVQTIRRIALVLALGHACTPVALASETDHAPQPGLAKLIAELTRQSVGDDQLRQSKSGIWQLDTAGGFQHVSLAQPLTGGHIRLGCVASLDQANAFYGRDIATGKTSAFGSAAAQREVQAAQLHGMSVPEYRFYSRLIDEFKNGAQKAGSSITIFNNDGPGEGFNSSAGQFLPAPGNDANLNLGAQRLALFNAAADVWENFLDSEVAIQVRSQFDPLAPCSTSGGVLGSAGAVTFYRDTTAFEYPDTWYHVALANKQVGFDINGATAEINATFNSDVDAGCLGVGTRFYYGLDNATPAGTVNLFVVLLHEMGHGLGFSTLVGSSGALSGGFADIWLRFMYDNSASKTWFAMNDGERAASAINTGNLYWEGANVIQAGSYLTVGRQVSTGRVQLYAPNPYEGGSSVSHYSSVVSPNVLMEPAINSGLSLDLDLTRQLMRDIGWYRDSNQDGSPDSITNVSPSSGSFAQGSSQTISWTNTTDFTRNVSIELSTDGGASYPTSIASNIANTGSFSWTVPSTPTNQARVRVREHDFLTPLGASSGNFTIASGNTAPSFTPAVAIDRQRGSAAGSAVPVGTASDAETSAGSLVVTQISGGSSAGVSAGSISNSNGSISAIVAASCSATAGTVRFQASDGALTGTGDLQVNLSDNTAPTLSYANSSLDGGSGTTVSPQTGLSDNGSIDSVVVHSAGTYSGGISVDAAGVVTLSAAAPVGTHTITIRATDNCGAQTDASFQLSVDNTAPSFTPAAAINRQQGSAAGAAVTVGTVSDAQTAAGSLVVSAIAGGTGSGLSISDLSNSSGTVQASVAASCSASTGTQRFQVSDGSLTGNGDLSVNVSANSAPTLAYTNASVNGSSSTTVSPQTGPSDNGSIDSVVVHSAGTYSGGISVDAAGVVTLSAAAPVGTHTITIRATDNCGAQTDASFQLSVDNTAPSFTPAAAINRQQGSAAGAAVTVGTVSDAQTAAGSLVVSAIAGGTGSGLSISNLSNSSGTVQASVAASCSASTGTQRFQVSDGSLTGNGDLSVNVSANSAPTLAYTNASVNGGSSTTVSPQTGPSDNGSIDSVVVHSAGTYSGGISVDAAGVVTLSAAAPVGTHTITIRATDNCGASTDASFQATVSSGNTAPNIVPVAGLGRQQGSAVGTAVVVATVSDAESSSGSLQVTLETGGTSSGISLSGITNSNGEISGVLTASCDATAGSLRLRVSDGLASQIAELNVAVTVDTAPVQSGYSSPRIVGLGSSLSIAPLAPPTDNGSIDSISVAALSPGFDGDLSSASLAGTFEVSNAGPVADHTLRVTASDNCGLQSQTDFLLRVLPNSIFSNGFE